MSSSKHAVAQFLSAWVYRVSTWPLLALMLVLLVTGLSAWLTVERFSINADMGKLIRQDTPWRDDYELFKDKFPVLYKTALVVVSGPSMEAVENTTGRLYEGFNASGNFDDVFAPLAEPYFRDSGLMFLSVDELEDLADRLASAQPVLTAIAEDPGLRGILDVLRLGIEEDGDAELEHLLRPLTESAEAIVRGQPGRVSWRDKFLDADEDKIHYSIISLKGSVDDGAAQPNSAIMAELRRIIAATAVDAGVDVRITGEIALSHEEIVAAQEGVRIAGIVSLLLLAAVLGFGVRSIKIVGATLLMLVVGVIWTAGWAMLSVGHFNALSLIFAIIFFGLGVDFAIHFSLRYQESLHRGRDNAAALREAAVTVGPSILLCTLTTAIGFLAFVPTEYQGLSELGIIAAGGMAVAAILIFTLLPALYMLIGPPRAIAPDLAFSVALVRRLIRVRFAVLAVIAALAVSALMVARHIHFDYSVLALRSPSSESMSTLRELQREGVVNEYTLSILTPDRDSIVDLQQRLEALPVVDSLETPLDYVPDEQQEKQQVLEDIQFLLWSALQPSRTEAAATDAELAASIAAMQKSIVDADVADAEVRELLRRLDHAMRILGEQGSASLRQWEQAVTSNLAEELDWLRRALEVGEIQFESLPSTLRLRLVSDDGVYRSAVLPSEDISHVEALSRFVESVRDIVPDVTGRPVVEWGLGEVVRTAFQQALLYAFIAVGLILWLTLRSLRDALMVLVPLLLAAVFTLALQVLIGMPLNMANILVLPLIFGLGVDNGIHVVHRYRHDGGVDALMHSSTPRAVILSTLTTIGTFAALSLSPHQGTASIGLLLSFAISFLLILVVFLLPVLLAVFGTRRSEVGCRTSDAETSGAKAL